MEERGISRILYIPMLGKVGGEAYFRNVQHDLYCAQLTVLIAMYCKRLHGIAAVFSKTYLYHLMQQENQV